jgi:CubicO group peptidase (beta-lactamase class C family)
MADTGWDVPSGDAVERASGYRLLDDGSPPVPDGDPLPHGDIAPMGGLWSSVADLARWVAFLLDAFPARDGADHGSLRRSSRREMQRVWRPMPVSIDRSEPERLRLTAAGYGAGLSMVDDEAIGARVGHSGGLPGYGSNMVWVPDRGIGVISLGNLRYAPMATLNRRVLEVLAAEGHLDRLAPRRTLPVAPALATLIEAMVALVNDWHDDRARVLFADNVEPDDGLDRRAARVRAVLARTGPLTVASVRATRATSATVTLTGERGPARLDLTLAPIVPARVQSFELTTTTPTAVAG